MNQCPALPSLGGCSTHRCPQVCSRWVQAKGARKCRATVWEEPSTTSPSGPSTARASWWVEGDEDGPRGAWSSREKARPSAVTPGSPTGRRHSSQNESAEGAEGSDGPGLGCNDRALKGATQKAVKETSMTGTRRRGPQEQRSPRHLVSVLVLCFSCIICHARYNKLVTGWEHSPKDGEKKYPSLLLKSWP